MHFILIQTATLRFIQNGTLKDTYFKLSGNYDMAIYK
jgi:hypothetical protein